MDSSRAVEALVSSRTADGETRRIDDVDALALFRRLSDAPDVTVVVPVHNGGSAVEECLQALAAHVGKRRVLLIDDASTDPYTQNLLQLAVARYGFELVTHQVNQGYTRTVNHGIDLAGDDDVVLLNSDAVIGPMALEYLRWVAYSQEAVASVTAASDNAGAMSLPEVGVANIWPGHLTWAEISRHLATAQNVWSQCVPTAHGFCVLIRREAVSAIGKFDEVAFSRGYGEENDWSQRADAAGFSNLYAPHVMVRHFRNQSFGSERRQLMSEGRQIVDGRWPNYGVRVREWLNGTELDGIREAARAANTRLEALERVNPCRLYVIHASTGGTIATNRDLMTALDDEQESLILESERGHTIRLIRFSPEGSEVLASWSPETPYGIESSWDDAYAEFVIQTVLSRRVEAIHIRHLIHTPITVVARVASVLGVPLIYSTHDFHPVCPTFTLLDEQLNYCGGACTSGLSNCSMIPAEALLEGRRLKNDWVHEWRRRMSAVIDAADHVIATSASAGSVLTQNFQSISPKLRIIEHGRDLADSEPLRPAGAPRRPGPLRVLAPAIWSPHKGPDLLRAIAQRVGQVAEFHVLGSGGEELDDVAIVHGEYSRENFRAIVEEIAPDIVGIFSIWPETYAHTVTEAWGFGVPVLATDLGAPAERIGKHGGGVTFPHTDPEAAVRILCELASAPERVSAMISPPPGRTTRSVQTMANDYRRLYRRARRRGRVHVVGIVDKGDRTWLPPSASIRAYRRALAVNGAEAVVFERLQIADYAHRLAPDVDVLMVVRDAVPAHLVDAVLSRARAAGTRIVLDLDDDLLTEDAMQRLEQQSYDRSRLVALSHLVRCVDQVTTSTAHLADAAAAVGGDRERITVVENQLDPRLWMSRTISSADLRLEEPAAEHELRILYMGSATHDEDLALLNGVIGDVTANLGKRAVLELVGVTACELPPGTRRLVPTDNEYPGFVAWLRARRNRWHAAVAPLTDNSFNRGKSDLKLLEYGALGLPVVASAVGPYRDTKLSFVRFANNRQQWIEQLTSSLTETQSLTDVSMRDELIGQGRVLDSSTAGKWLRVLLGDCD